MEDLNVEDDHPIDTENKYNDREWRDYSTASPWEEFIVVLEGKLGELGIGSQKSPGSGGGKAVESSSNRSGSTGSKEEGAIIPSRAFSFEGKEFVLQHVLDSTSSSVPSWSDGKGHYTPSMISLAHPVILGECLPDLPFKDAHVDLIRTMYGLSSFVLLRPKVTTGPFATSLSQSESSTLLSSLRLAMLARGSSLPFFVTRHAASRFSFVGQCLPGTNGASTITFSSDVRGETPPNYNHLSGLLDLFKAKTKVPFIDAYGASGTGDRNSEIVISVMSTWKYREGKGNSADDRTDDAILGTAVKAPRPSITAIPWRSPEDQFTCESPRVYQLLKAIEGPREVPLWGPSASANPISSIHISCCWNNFAENSYVENDVYSSLNCLSATAWQVLVAWDEEEGLHCPVAARVDNMRNSYVDALNLNPAYTLGELVASITKKMKKGEDRGRSSSADEDDVDRDSGSYSGGEHMSRYGNKNIPAARAAAVIGSALGTITRSIVKAAAFSEKIPSIDEIHAVLQEIFLIGAGESDVANTPQPGDEPLALPKVAPVGSLLSLLSIRMSEVNSGGIAAMALMWTEFVKHLRYRWENSQMMPRMGPLVDGNGAIVHDSGDQSVFESNFKCPAPDMSYSIIYQKLQLLNACIFRRAKARALYGSAADDSVHDENSGAAPVDGWKDDLDLGDLDKDIETQEDWGDNWDDATDLFNKKPPAADATPVEKAVTPSPSPSSKKAASPSSTHSKKAAAASPKSGSDDEGFQSADDGFQSADDGGGDEEEEGEEEGGDKKEEKEEIAVTTPLPPPVSVTVSSVAPLPPPAPVTAALPSEADIDREGAKCPVDGGKRMIATGHVLYVPCTQDEELFTEDMLADQLENVSKLGNSSTNKHHHQLQSQSLFSDMQSFKAANPGCVLEDFIRWHSPKDWVIGSGEDKDDSKPEWARGHLSERMKSPDNIWHQLWSDAKPLAAKRQPLIFDFQTEAEKALDYLEAIKPVALIGEMLTIATASYMYYLSKAKTPACKAPTVQKLKVGMDRSAAALYNESLHLTRNKFEDISKHWERIRDVIGDYEQGISRATALISRLPDQNELVDELVKSAFCNPTTPDSRLALLNLLVTDGAASSPSPSSNTSGSDIKQSLKLLPPENRVYIMKCESSRPWNIEGKGIPFQDGPNTLYAAISKKEFRVATAIQDSDF